jgi:hypothetical protein
MRRNRLAGLALIAGLAGGGMAGALFGGPGISGAQETPTTTAPADDAAPGPEGRGPGGPGGCHGGHRGAGLDAAATALGMTTEELRAQLDVDTTIADVAKAKNVDVQKVIDAMVADAKAHLDQAVTDGRLTQAEADAKKADLTDRITTLVNEGPPARGDRPAPPAA